MTDCNNCRTKLLNFEIATDPDGLCLGCRLDKTKKEQIEQYLQYALLNDLMAVSIIKGKTYYSMTEKGKKYLSNPKY